MYKHKKHHCQDHKMKTILHNVLYNPAQNLVYTHPQNPSIWEYLN